MKKLYIDDESKEKEKNIFIAALFLITDLAIGAGCIVFDKKNIFKFKDHIKTQYAVLCVMIVGVVGALYFMRKSMLPKDITVLESLKEDYEEVKNKLTKKENLQTDKYETLQKQEERNKKT